MTTKSRLFVGLLVVVAIASAVLYASRPGAEGQVTEYNLVQLRQGWNLVVWAADSQTADSVFGFANIAIVYGWQPDSQSFTRYVPGRPEVSTLGTAEKDSAYWLLSNSDALFQVPAPDGSVCPEPSAYPSPSPSADCGQCASALASCVSALDTRDEDFWDMSALLDQCQDDVTYWQGRASYWQAELNICEMDRDHWRSECNLGFSPTCCYAHH